MSEITQWYKAEVVAKHPALPPAYEPGLKVLVSMAPCGVRIWARLVDDWGRPSEGPWVVTPEVAQQALKTERVDGRPVRAADGATIEHKWSFYFSA